MSDWSSDVCSSDLDADGDLRPPAEAAGDLAQRLQLGQRFDVDLPDVLLQGEGHFRARLADAGEDDAGRRNAGAERAAQFAFGDHVDAGAQLGEGAEDRKSTRLNSSH